MSADGQTTAKRSVSYYDMLSVSPHDSDEAIKSSYRRMALKFHPDCNPLNRDMAEHRFRLITQAYEAVKSAEGRQRYDQWLQTQSRQQQTGQAGNDNVHSWLSLIAKAFTPRQKRTAL